MAFSPVSQSHPTTRFDLDTVKERINSFLDNTKELACGILGKTIHLEDTSVINPPLVIHHHYHHWYWPWYSFSHNHHCCERNIITPSTGRDKDQLAKAAVLVGGLSLIYAVIRVAQNIGTLLRVSTELDEVKDFKKWIQKISDSSHIKISNRKEIDKVVGIKERTFYRTQVDAKVDLFLKGVLGLGSVFLIHGGLTSSVPNMWKGVYVASAAALGIFFKWTLNYMEIQNQKDAEKLLLKITDINSEQQLAYNITPKQATQVEVESPMPQVLESHEPLQESKSPEKGSAVEATLETKEGSLSSTKRSDSSLEKRSPSLTKIEEAASHANDEGTIPLI